MLVRFSKTIIAVAISSTLGIGAVWAQAQPQAQPAQQAKPAKNWKDRAEYDLYVAITKEADPKKALDLLNQWSQKYPNTDFKQERYDAYLVTYQKLGDRDKMLQTAREALNDFPTDFQALYAVTLLTPAPQNVSNPDALALGEKAARGFLDNLNEVFAPAKKPASVSDEAWNKEKTAYESLGHRTLGWIAMVRKNYAEAETQLLQDLKLNPNDAEGAYWLGTSMIAQKQPDKFSNAMYFIARAACYAGPGALPDPNRKQIEAYLTKTYTGFHGQDAAGLEALCNQAKASALPPAEFKILSSEEISAHKEQQLMQTNPQLAFWLKLKSALEAPDGEQYFQNGMKDAVIPPEGQPMMKGTVISEEPAKNPKTIVVGISSPTTSEVTLKIVTPEGTPGFMPGRAEPGTAIEFRGIASAFTKQPFNVTFDVERKNITGWPAPAPPAKKAAPKKGARKK